MDGGGGGGPTNIIIRTPDQRVKDLQVTCEPTWTVANLKQKLSELYPGNPKETSQRLILAGKLLQDATPLEELFKQYDYVPIVHFVCTQLTRPDPEETTNHSTNSTPSSESASPDPLPPPPPPLPANTRWSAHMSSLETWHQQLQANQAAVYHHHLTQAVRRHVENTQRENEPASETQAVPDQPVAAQAPPPAAAAQAAMQGADVLQQQPGDMMQPAAAAAAAVQQEPIDQERHDLLDIFYLIIRSMFLLALVWNYSSPAKFCFMAVSLFYLYLYQAGYISLPDFISRELDGGSNEGDPENTRLSRIRIFRNVLVSFFTSLLPSNDIDNNLNN